MTNEEAVRAAEQAKMVLDNPMVQSALTEIESAVIDQWRSVSVQDKDQAEELKRLLWAAQQFRAIFEVTIGGGVVAKNELLNASTMLIRAEASKRRIYG